MHTALDLLICCIEQVGGKEAQQPAQVITAEMSGACMQSLLIEELLRLLHLAYSGAPVQAYCLADSCMLFDCRPPHQELVLLCRQPARRPPSRLTAAR